MKSIQFAPKWPRFARLSLALATLAVPVCTLAQSTISPGTPLWTWGRWARRRRKASHLRSAAMGWSAGRLFSPTPTTPPNGYRTLSCGKEPKRKIIGSPGFGGPNSVAFGVNFWGQAAGQADTRTPDPNGEDFCGSTALGLTHSGNTCVPFLWQNGTMIALPRLRNSAGTEGSNGVALADQRLRHDSRNGGKRRSGLDLPGRDRFAADDRVQACHLDESLPLVAGTHPGASRPLPAIRTALLTRSTILAKLWAPAGNCGPFNAIAQNNLTPLHAVLWRDGKAIEPGKPWRRR